MIKISVKKTVIFKNNPSDIFYIFFYLIVTINMYNIICYLNWPIKLLI